jgi:hypothetical protein
MNDTDDAQQVREQFLSFLNRFTAQILTVEFE